MNVPDFVTHDTPSDPPGAPAYRLTRARHGHFFYNPNDLFIGRSLELYGEWCEDELDLLRQVVPTGAVVIDAGANIGTHTVFLARHVGGRGFVHAFEPQRLSFQLLCANVAANGLVNVGASQRALGSAGGSIKVPVLAWNARQNFGGVSLGSYSEGEDVPVIRIDDLGLEACHLIKIDVEGMETDVLEGARVTIGRFSPLLFLECDRPARNAALFDALKNLGYRAFWHVCPYFREANFRGCRENVFGNLMPSVNLMAVPASLAGGRIEMPEMIGPGDTWQAALERWRRR